MRVDVYWNLHKDCYSIRACEGPQKGRVIAHTDDVSLIAATFVVRATARAKVIETHCKSVHAWVRGELADTIALNGLVGVTYNPYREATFVRRADRSPILQSSRVRMTIVDGRANVSAA